MAVAVCASETSQTSISDLVDGAAPFPKNYSRHPAVRRPRLPCELRTIIFESAQNFRLPRDFLPTGSLSSKDIDNHLLTAKLDIMPTPESEAFLAKKPKVPPTFENVDFSDQQAVIDARDAIIREQFVKTMMARLVREEMGKCYAREGVNHLEKCGKYRGRPRCRNAFVSIANSVAWIRVRRMTLGWVETNIADRSLHSVVEGEQGKGLQRSTAKLRSRKGWSRDGSRNSYRLSGCTDSEGSKGLRSATGKLKWLWSQPSILIEGIS